MQSAGHCPRVCSSAFSGLPNGRLTPRGADSCIYSNGQAPDSHRISSSVTLVWSEAADMTGHIPRLSYHMPPQYSIKFIKFLPQSDDASQLAAIYPRRSRAAELLSPALRHGKAEAGAARAARLIAAAKAVRPGAYQGNACIFPSLYSSSSMRVPRSFSQRYSSAQSTSVSESRSFMVLLFIFFILRFLFVLKLFVLKIL